MQKFACDLFYSAVHCIHLCCFGMVMLLGLFIIIICRGEMNMAGALTNTPYLNNGLVTEYSSNPRNFSVCVALPVLFNAFLHMCPCLIVAVLTSTLLV